MTRHITALVLVLLVGPAWAQGAEGRVVAAVPATLSATTDEQLDARAQAERERIGKEREVIEARYAQERAACYSRFAVNDCLTDSRRKRRELVEELGREEAAINDAERQRKGDAALKRLEALNAKSSGVDAEEARKRALDAQQNRDQRAAEQATQRQQRETEAVANRREWEEKQRANAAENAQRQERRSQEATERAAYDAKVEAARKARADLDARNASRDKPRAAPLPPPPP
jgi:colicin import membrane protein